MLLNHSILYLLIKLSNAILGFYVTVYLTSTLGPNQFGKYSQIISLTILIGSFLYLPITASISRFLQQVNDIEQFVKTIYFTYGIVTITTTCLLFFICYIANELDYFLMIVPLIIFKGIHDVNLEISRAKLNPIRYGLQSILQILLFVLIIDLYFYGGGYFNYIYILVGSYILSSLFFFNYTRGELNKKYLKKIYTYGRTLILVYFLGFLFQLIDKQLIAYYLASEYLAFYQVTNTLIQSVLLLLISSFSMTCYPLLVKNYNTDNFLIINKKMFYLTFGFSIPMLFGVIAISPELIKIFFGEVYFNNTKDILWIISISIFNIAIASNYFDFSFKLTNNNLKQVKVFYIPIAIIIIGNYFYVNKYGIYASAIVFFVATLIMLISTIIEGRKYLKLYFDIWYIIISIFISFLMLYIVSYVNTSDDITNLILKIILGVVFYISVGGIYIWKKIN